jgi:hypothetical protein
MVQFLVFKNERGDEYAFIPLPVPVDALEFRSIPQILPHALTEVSPFLVMGRSQPLSSFGATSLQHQTAILGGHASAKTVSLCASSVVGLKGALRHRNEFSL